MIPYLLVVRIDYYLLFVNNSLCQRKSCSKRGCLWIIKAFSNRKGWGSSRPVREFREIED